MAAGVGRTRSLRDLSHRPVGLRVPIPEPRGQALGSRGQTRPVETLCYAPQWTRLWPKTYDSVPGAPWDFARSVPLCPGWSRPRWGLPPPAHGRAGGRARSPPLALLCAPAPVFQDPAPGTAEEQVELCRGAAAVGRGAAPPAEAGRTFRGLGNARYFPS